MRRYLPLLKPLLFLLCLVPVARLGWGLAHDTLGANPIEFLTRSLGTWTLNFLLITLSVTPLRKLSGWHWLMQLRRMLGLYAFFYGLLHLSSYLWLDQFFDWGEIGRDILKRPFITAGMTAFLLMAPLAVTSTNAMIRRLGGQRWQSLHRLVYAVALLGVLHYAWLVKKDVSQPILYGTILLGLLGFRVVVWLRSQKRQAAVPKRKIIPIVNRS
ncbi:MAG: sulfoxide reductase heme-binding subunit YedZ [Rhodocyclaceae bacterium]|jgi:sulfoxide reductase heme-binding subunit YedZ|nr:sulfoxide reductase heme-binding subunit YedZ [Rhodocyclaceae bacterium]